MTYLLAVDDHCLVLGIGGLDVDQRAVHLAGARDVDNQALSYFDRALGADEENVQAWKGSGYARVQLEETEAAIRDFEEAHRLAPGDADVALALARLLYQSDELARGKQVLDVLLAEQDIRVSK